MKKGNPIALLPIGVFLVLYLGLGLLFEYGLHIPMGFYNIPIVIAFLVSILVACLQNRAVPFEEKLVIMGQGVGDKNIITMLLIFLTAGAFVGVVGRSSAQSVAYFMLDIIPARFAVAVLFVVACFVSTAMGTSVGTITLIMPIALEVAQASGFDTALCTGSVVGGAMFGDNLSFISDTTIASTTTQGCSMSDKFKANIWICGPAAVIVTIIYLIIGLNHGATPEIGQIEYVKLIPYLTVIVLALCGINVLVVLGIGLVLSAAIGFLDGMTWLGFLGSVGDGIGGMGELIIVTMLSGGMLELIRHNGGLDFIIRGLTKGIKGKRGAEFSIAGLVGLSNLCTANNTIAILTTGDIARDITGRFGLDPRKSASLLDTFSCIVQGIIPYGAQLLMASGFAGIAATQIIPCLFYPFVLCAVACLSIIFRFPKRYS